MLGPPAEGILAEGAVVLRVVELLRHAPTLGAAGGRLLGVELRLEELARSLEIWRRDEDLAHPVAAEVLECRVHLERRAMRALDAVLAQQLTERLGLRLAEGGGRADDVLCHELERSESSGGAALLVELGEQSVPDAPDVQHAVDCARATQLAAEARRVRVKGARAAWQVSFVPRMRSRRWGAEGLATTRPSGRT